MPQAGAARRPAIHDHQETAMNAMPTAAVQLESVLRTVLNVLIAPGSWLAEVMPELLLPGAVLAGAGLLAVVLRKFAHL
jgi:hypothetical protein